MELGIVGYKNAADFTSEQFFVIDAILAYLSDNNISWDYDTYIEDEESLVCSGFIKGDKVEHLIDTYCKVIGESDFQIFENPVNCYQVKNIFPIMQGHILEGKYFIRFLK